jgi:hypothetical protein
VSNRRRLIILALVAVGVWYVCTFVFWAIPKQHDAVPVGIDRTLTNPRTVSQEVTCNDLFTSAARPDEPLPTLVEQPAGYPPLSYQRTPCTTVHSQARTLFAINSVILAVVAVGGIVLLTRRDPDHTLPAADLQTTSA